VGPEPVFEGGGVPFKNWFGCLAMEKSYGMLLWSKKMTKKWFFKSALPLLAGLRASAQQRLKIGPLAADDTLSGTSARLRANAGGIPRPR
jgi:hypothetical protein